MPSITVGTDLEVFGKKGDYHVALCGKIGGTKEEPKQVKGMPDGFMVQEDNVSLEFNIPPAASAGTFVTYIVKIRKHVYDLLDSLGLEPSMFSAVSFDKKELTHPNALVFGCEPDYNAWTRRENTKPQPKDKNLRTAGGHVHVGTTEVDMLDGIKYMDLYLGVPSILLDDSPASLERRQSYGKAGAMRPKPYGFEYRTLSNFWMFDDALVRWVFNNTYAAMETAYLCKVGRKKPIPHEDCLLIQECINNGDKGLAKTLIDKYCIPMPKNKEQAEAYYAQTMHELIVNNPWIVAANPPATGAAIIGTQDDDLE